ncbi:MAG: isochorismatase family protein, partial [Planctomycetota bacterium]|nr:isochorismatase family protein [Planctomycetota bacterium]
MPLSVLITQCLQVDFVGPVGRHEPLPNRLHVGHAESLRLLGPDPQAGPVAQAMHWARRQPREAFAVIHIRDWHDANDPAQQDHLRIFGNHCLKHTPGARLVLDLDDAPAEHPNETLVDSISLNDFLGTTLEATLDALKARAPDGRLRIGIVGVWTDAKVNFLAYELKSRCGLTEVATCSALTASASRARHFLGLDQLQGILGVPAFESIGDFEDWLRPGSKASAEPPLPCFGPKVEIGDGGALSPHDREIAAYLFKDSARVTLKPLAGGFSGAQVLRSSSEDALGHRQAPCVVKLGERKLIGKERVAFERVEEILGNNAPSVRGFVDFGERAGIKYSFAAMGEGSVTSLKALFERGEDPRRIARILQDTFKVVLGPFYAAARYEKLPLLEHYAFDAKWAPGVRKNVEAIVGAEAALGERLAFPGGFEARNVCLFYERFLAAHRPLANEHHYVSYVHGDLNGANILLDGRGNTWVIDFFHTGPGHVLRDLAKLENDILYIFTPLRDEAELAEALRITARLRQVEDLWEPLPDSCEGLASPALLRAWAMLRELRALGADFCHEDRNPLQLKVALLRYAVHTLSFDESSPLQKRWALASACALAEDIEQTIREDTRLRVDWIARGDLPASGRLGVTLCPGRMDRGRDLREDLGTLAKEGVRHLLCLATPEELDWAGVPDLPAQAAAHGLNFLHEPIADQGVPSREQAARIVETIRGAVGRGETFVAHCIG